MNLRVICITLTGSLLLVAASAGFAVEQTENFTGYTRPGWPNDARTADKIVFAADNPELRETAIGGTVYFTVLQLTGKNGDSWSAGLPKFDGNFRTGIDLNGTASPMLDTSARYLYLYQVVNDRKTPAPILSVSIKLIVDPHEITSWGHFHGAGFAISVKGENEVAGEQLRPVSFTNVIAASLVDKSYRTPDEARPDVRAAPQVVYVPTKLGEEAPLAKDDQRLLKVVWDALDPALDPNHIMLLPQSDFNQKPCFRAVWNPDNAIKKDVRSTLFGFTSNRPPTYEPVRLRGLRKVKSGEIKPAADFGPAKLDEIGLFRDDLQGAEVPAGLVGAEGKAPTPLPEHRLPELDTPPAGAPSSGSFPPQMPPPPGAPAGGGGFGGGGGGFTPPPPSTGGGGISGGGSQNQNKAAATGTQTGTQTQSVVIGSILTSQASIAQFQAQQPIQISIQINDGRSGRGIPSSVVPQPAALLLAALGLPALLLLAWRGRGVRQVSDPRSI